MREYPTSKIVHVWSAIASVKDNAIHHRARGGAWPSDERYKVQRSVRAALPFLDELGLNSAKALVEELAQGLTGSLNVDHAEQTANNIRLVIEAQLKERTFFVINPEHLRFYNNPLLAGQQFKDNWPNANRELIDAGNCFALDQHTACACHLMRAMEYVLRSFENALGIARLPRSTWGSIIEGIDTKKGRKPISIKGHPTIPAASPSAKWKKNVKFFGDCYSFICGVKSSCRDDVFHVVSTYDEPGAKQLMDSVSAFLSKASEQLNEIK